MSKSTKCRPKVDDCHKRSFLGIRNLGHLCGVVTTRLHFNNAPPSLLTYPKPYNNIHPRKVFLLSLETILNDFRKISQYIYTIYLVYMILFLHWYGHSMLPRHHRQEPHLCITSHQFQGISIGNNLLFDSTIPGLSAGTVKLGSSMDTIFTELS